MALAINADAKKWGIIVLVGFSALALTAYLCFHQGQESAREDNKTLGVQAKMLARQADSLARVAAYIQKRIDSAQTRIDQYQIRDSLFQRLLIGAYRDKNALMRKYNALSNYDSLPAADIQRYLSDSLP